MMTMLTREEFLESLKWADDVLSQDGEFSFYAKRLDQNDQAQRAVIARLEAERKDLVMRNKLLRDRPDLPLERIQAYDEVITKIEQQAKEISDLKDIDSKEYQEHHRHCSEYSVKIAKLREALQDKDDDVRHLTASVMQLVAIVRGSIYISDVTQSILFKAEHLLKVIGEKQAQHTLKEVS